MIVQRGEGVGTEIERKFLVVGDSWRGLAEGTDMRQGYLSTVAQRTVRVRLAGDQAYLTVKGPSVGATRAEFEYEIPVADAEQLLAMCEGSLIEKTRYRIPADEVVWEVDEFQGDNAGLLVAECELETADQEFARPEWLGNEVTDDARYYNANLSKQPFKNW